MADFVDLVLIAWQISVYLIYFSIVIHFLDKNSTEKFKFLLIVIGVFAILFLASGSFSFLFYNPEWPFFVTPMFLMSFLALAGIKLMIDRRIVLLLLVIFLFSLTSTVFISFLVGITTYIIVAVGFISSALRIIHHRTSGTSPAPFTGLR